MQTRESPGHRPRGEPGLSWPYGADERLLGRPFALPPTPGPEALDVLTPRELDVLAELAGGRRNRDIAALLRVTEHTATFHVANILSKLGVHTRGQAAAFAREARL